jgi:hypothetical protein
MRNTPGPRTEGGERTTMTKAGTRVTDEREQGVALHGVGEHSERGRERSRWWTTALLSASVVVGAGCGAKTGLTVPCSVEVVTTKPEVVLVLDRSNSLVDLTVDGTPLIDAVKDAALRIVPQFEGAGDMGLVLFPADNDMACGGAARWTVPLGENNGAAMTREIRAMQAFGLTPTWSAIRLAADTLRARAAVAPNQRRFIVLATDGGANCNEAIPLSECRCTSPQSNCEARDGIRLCFDDRRLVSEVRQLREEGIDTIVIGLNPEQDSSFYVEFLRTLAIAGGSFGGREVPFLAAQDRAQIEAVLSRAILEPSYCVLGLSNGAQRVPDALVAGGARFERGVRDGDGWDVDREHPERIRLVGSLCRHAVSQRILAWDGVWNQRCVMYP